MLQSDRSPVGLATALRLGVGLVVLEAVALGLLGLARPGHLLAAAVAIAGFYLGLVAVAAWGVAHHGLAWPFSYDTSLEQETTRRARDPQYVRLYGRVDRYLTNTSRPDELHPQLVEIVRWRLRENHGIALEDRAAAEPLLGPALADYVYSPPTTHLRGRSRARLNAVLNRIEEL